MRPEPTDPGIDDFRRGAHDEERGQTHRRMSSCANARLHPTWKRGFAASTCSMEFHLGWSSFQRFHTVPARAQCRAPLLTRQRAMGEGVDVEGGEVQGRV